MEPARPPRSRSRRTGAPARRGTAARRLTFKEKVRRLFTWPVMKRVLKWGALVGLVLTALVAIAVAITFWVYASDPKLPTVDKLKNYDPKQVTRIVVPGKHGDEVIGEIYTQRRTMVAYDDVPPLLVDAFVVIEDANFWEHSGIDYKGMVRAFFANLLSGKAKQGASTITQQVVKNLLLTPEKSFRRKMQEIILARRLESSLTKEEILELYVNEIYFGHGRYGVVEAARFYFGKELEQLDVGEMALLGGLPQAPEDISPLKNPARAKRRQTDVLNAMVKHGKIEPEEAQRFINRAIQTVADPYPRLAVAPEVVDLVKKELLAEHGDQALDKLGATVRVTLKPELQEAARAALQKRLRAYDEDHKVGVPIRKVAADKIAAEVKRLARKLPDSGPVAGEIYDAVVTGVFDADHELEVDLGGATAAVVLDGADDERFNPADDDGRRKPPSARFAIGDVVEVMMHRAGAVAKPKHGGGRAARLAPGPEGAVVVIDVRTRKVLALVGGYHVRPGGFNRAVQARRQPGSTFKPFVYAAALAAGRYTAATIVNDAPDVFDLWKPKNYGKCCEGPVRLRHALAKSINTVAIRVCHDLGPVAVAALAHAMGVESELPEHLSLSLGSGEVTPLELTNAFASFAAGGVFTPARIIDAVDGKLRPTGATTQALSPQVAYVVVDMMRSVVEEGTATAVAKALKLTVAGKTGTSNDERDAWFLGITPEYAIGTWIGHDDNRPLGAKQTGGSLAVPVFIDVIKAIGPRARRFERPPGLVDVRIDKATGLLAADGAPDGSSYAEVFVEGTAPTEIAPLAGEVDTDTFVTDEYDDEPPPAAEDAEPVASP